MQVVVEDLGAVAEALRDEYVERDGKYVLKLEGDVPGMVVASELEEQKKATAHFRDSNVGLNSKIGDLTTRLDEISGLEDKYTSAVTELETLKKTAPKKDAEMQAIQAQLESLAKKLDESNAREVAARQQAARKDLESQLRTVGSKLGVRDEAWEDFLSRGTAVFQLTEEDGKVVAKRGEEPLFSEINPALPLTMQEWGERLQRQAAHLFKESTGGGARPSDTSGSTTGMARMVSEDQFGGSLEDIAAGKAVVQ